MFNIFFYSKKVINILPKLSNQNFIFFKQHCSFVYDHVLILMTNIFCKTKITRLFRFEFRRKFKFIKKNTELRLLLLIIPNLHRKLNLEKVYLLVNSNGAMINMISEKNCSYLKFKSPSETSQKLKTYFSDNHYSTALYCAYF